jgi:hypothetical protein
MKEYRNLEKYVFDIIVIGGGMGGICAAIAAARLGSKVALVHDRPVLGGATSTEVRVNIGGADHPRMVRSARETGIIEELRIEDRYRNYAQISNSFINSTWDMVLWEYVTREPNLTLFLNTSARHAIMKEENKKIIKGIEAVQLGSEKFFHLFADFFIDASGDGAIAYDAGAEFRMGRESRSEFNESIAPEKADDYVIGGAALLFKVTDVGHPIHFERPSWAYEFPTDRELPFRNHSNWQNAGFWWMMYGGTLNTVFDYEKIRDELYKILYGVWDHVKNHGDHGAKNYALEWVGAVPGKLESRRFMGDNILTQNDIMIMTQFPDSVSYGGAAIDLHPPEGVFSPEPPTNEHETLLPGLYSIPFRCLYSKNVDNLMMAGRIISTTHVAHGTTRFIATGAVNGQAVGTAAYLCKKYSVTPRELYQKHIHELQQLLLKNDCYIIGLKNEDLGDFAKTTSVTASSSAKLEITNHVGAHALTCTEIGWHGMKRAVNGRAQLFPVSESFI